MKKCPHCGAKAQDWVAACPSCKSMFDAPRSGGLQPVSRAPVGAPPGGPMAAAPPPYEGTPTLLPLAVWAFVLSLTCLWPAGIIAALVALSRYRAEPGRYSGRWMAVVGLWVGLLAGASTILLLIFSFLGL